jgi:hypothetical protein
MWQCNRATRAVGAAGGAERGHRHEGAPDRAAGGVAAAAGRAAHALRAAAGHAAHADQGHQRRAGQGPRLHRSVYIYVHFTNSPTT